MSCLNWPLPTLYSPLWKKSCPVSFHEGWDKCSLGPTDVWVSGVWSRRGRKMFKQLDEKCFEYWVLFSRGTEYVRRFGTSIWSGGRHASRQLPYFICYYIFYIWLPPKGTMTGVLIKTYGVACALSCLWLVIMLLVELFACLPLPWRVSTASSILCFLSITRHLSNFKCGVLDSVSPVLQLSYWRSWWWCCWYMAL